MKRPKILGIGTIALLLAILTLLLLVLTAPAIGLTWDEPAYIAGAKSIAGWFQNLVRQPQQMLSEGAINRYWTTNHEHPPVDKIISALVWMGANPLFDDLTAHRLGNMLLVSLLVALVFLLIARQYGRAAGLFAATALLSMPRFFFHAHLAALDVPVAVGTFALTWLFWKTRDRKGWGWGLLLGMAWGLVVATKLNGVFVPIALVIWSLIFKRNWALVFRFFLMGISAVLTFFLVWPWLYHDTWARVMEYVNFHLNHYQIGQWYFGSFYLPPPWHFVLVILGVVVPLSILLLALLGATRAGRGTRDGGLAWLLIISTVVAISPFLFGKSLLYDNDRLFMPVYPFLACLAGIGFSVLAGWVNRLTARFNRPMISITATILLAMGALAPQSLAMAELYPHLLSYYSESIGGLRGATRHSLETTYWCETYASALPYINDHAKPGETIWVDPWSYDVLIYYQTMGRLRQDVQILNPYPVLSVLGPLAPSPVAGGIQAADWVIFQYRQSSYGPDEGRYYPLRYISSRTPVFELSFQDIPLMQLYHISR